MMNSLALTASVGMNEDLNFYVAWPTPFHALFGIIAHIYLKNLTYFYHKWHEFARL
jgi:hypothetical protein